MVPNRFDPHISDKKDALGRLFYCLQERCPKLRLVDAIIPYSEEI